jgi:predicted aconitase
VKLSSDERAMLEGKGGLAKQRAMELLVRYAQALSASSFINCTNVTLILGALPDVECIQQIVPSLDADEIASKIFLGSDDVVIVDKVSVFTSTNAYFYDQAFPYVQRGGKDACDLSSKIEEYCKRIGVVHLATCTPYQSGNIPTKGEHCAWTESSAIAFCNSILGARTNIEGPHSSFASCITGKTPLHGMHLDSNRLATVVANVEAEMSSILDWNLLGYYMGKQVGLEVPAYTGIKEPPDLNMLMALCSSGIASGSIVMFHIVGVTPEAPSLQFATGSAKISKTMKYGNSERKMAYEMVNFSKKDEVDVVVLGCPHYSLERLNAVTRMLEGKTIHHNMALYITTCRTNKSIADRLGYTEIIERAGGIVLEDSCGNILDLKPSQVLATDSAKLVRYIPGMTGIQNIWCGTTQDCIEAAISGKWRGELK